jgi:hypothetical protein
MAAKRRISAAEMVKDIRAGLTDLELMNKYNLSPKGLQSAMRKLLEARFITQAEYDWRPSEYDDTVAISVRIDPDE